MGNAAPAFILYIIAAGLQAASLFVSRQKGIRIFSRLAISATALAILWLCLSLVYRSILIGFPALTSSYEGLLFFSAAIGACAILLPGRRSSFSHRFVSHLRLWSCILSASLLALGSSPLAPADISYPVPALRSAWLVLHVAFSFLGESAFALSFIAALVWFFSRDSIRRRSAERIASASVSVGYPLYTVGALVFGAIWAQYTWGRYWGWDPKEIWALITWLVYSLYLHVRLTRHARTKIAMFILLLGFPIALFTFLGVNLLADGLHSY